jgi:tetratricopeptide (TPR) repeat protein
MPVKLKISRKELKKPDEFISLTGRMINYGMQHSRQVLSIMAVVLFICGLAFLAIYYYSKKESNAQITLAQGMMLFRQGLYLKEGNIDPSKAQLILNNALKSLEEVYSKYPRTESGEIALLYGGNICLLLSDYSKAISLFERALSGGGIKGEIKEMCLNGLAHSYEMQKNYEKLCNIILNLPKSKVNSQWELPMKVCQDASSTWAIRILQ